LTAAKGLALQCHVAPELNGRYISDPLRLRQIVNNLLSNAVKFTQKGEISLTAGYDSSKLTIAIADTGKGMASEDRERIFQEFTRLSGAQGEEGFGLGLSIVKKLVTLLEGTIDVQSTLGKGSCFTVTLPLYPVGKSIAESESPESENVDITEEEFYARMEEYKRTLAKQFAESRRLEAEIMRQLDSLQFNNINNPEQHDTTD